MSEFEKMKMSEFLLWFYGGQTRQWLINELVKGTVDFMDKETRTRWVELAHICEVQIV